MARSTPLRTSAPTRPAPVPAPASAPRAVRAGAGADPVRPVASNDDPAGGFIAGYLPYLLARASHLTSGEFHERLARERVPVMQWRVMAALWDGPKSARDVAEIILQKQPTVSKLLERMEKQGVLSRQPDADDRRRIAVRLTAAGRRVAGPLIDAARRHERAVLEPFGTANAAMLLRMLQHLIDRHR